MYIYENYVIDAPERKRANFKIVPFLEADLTTNKKLSLSRPLLTEYFEHRFPNYRIVYTPRGRSGIIAALHALDLQKNDEVTIFTTSGNLYISSCVTNEIEKVCRWSREITTNTKAILVNHEFGYCYENLEELKHYNLPIIEDFAHSFTASNDENTQGTIGDFLLFSFSKFFPIQIGGVLLYKKHYSIKEEIHSNMKQYIQNVVGSYIDSIEEINQKRLNNYLYLKTLFQTLGCTPYMPLKKGAIPAVFMFTLPRHIDLLLLKEYMNRQGVESSIFYGSHAYFIPSHQNFKEEDLFYFYILIKYFFENHAPKGTYE